MQLSLDSPVQYVPRVGPAMAEKLKNLQIHTVKDLLYHVPFRYNDYSLVSPIGRLQAGETVTIKGTVTSMKHQFTKTGKKIQEAILADDTGEIHTIWFNQPYLVQSLPPGTVLGVSGTVQWFGHQLVLSSPEYEILGASSDTGLHTGRIVPVYPLTEGVSAKWLRGRVAFLLEALKEQLTDNLPESIRASHHLLPLTEAIQLIHFPQTHEDHARARRRLAFDELFFLQLTARYMRHMWETTQTSPNIKMSPADLTVFLKNLPFELTGDQKRAIDDVMQDLSRPIPMNRLLEGDVGSGKTVVAAAAIYATWRNNHQSLFMAPTQILAEQHFVTLQKLLTPLGVRVDLITGSSKMNTELRIENRDKKQNSQFSIHNSQFDILVGTHALLNQVVKMDKLGLVAIDEQQRFGVRQRQVLRDKGQEKTPHLLTMTATPIPRTIALTMYGNLDLSTIKELPKGRVIVKTWVVPKEKREAAYAWINKQLAQHKTQAFIVCPLIEESETLTTVRAVKKEFERLQKIFSGVRLGLLHGRMKAKEKTAVLEGVHGRNIDILVTTPVVEVGIDVPNASIMLIEAAERFGLSQLHQLRGRVGRGSVQSYCLLFTEATDESTITRLRAMEKTHNGPELAELDLKMRGPGELLGTRQHGIPVLKIASFSDTELIATTQRAAKATFEQDPSLAAFPHLREALKSATIEATD